MNEENLTYADAMQRLEDISARLENGSVPLAVSYTHLTLPTNSLV